ncbi:unnamed protein product [Effrenium voratum]|uniref:Uncharacterized protein n=1 Tax=Effrenium voratum TaxID=2562239 RepID=A0AA36MZ83_9DINO|nr:unnamed protein product [Effrenium voratum]CAJ1385096.1 unnamed protein product [Effrenium voratum]CAJ1448346.1 unnamed protein product [Effrenium voratum]
MSAPPFPFQPFSLRPALIFHKLYHSSRGIQVNHWVLLPCYLVSLFLTLAASWAQILAFALLAVYALALTGAPMGGSYTLCVLSPCLFLAWAIADSLGNPWWPIRFALGQAGCLVSLLLQLLGHKLCEKLKPEPAPMHGFVAAPMLEWQVVWMEAYLALNSRPPQWLFNLEEPQQVFSEAKRMRLERESWLR